MNINDYILRKSGNRIAVYRVAYEQLTKVSLPDGVYLAKGDDIKRDAELLATETENGWRGLQDPVTNSLCPLMVGKLVAAQDLISEVLFDTRCVPAAKSKTRIAK